MKYSGVGPDMKYYYKSKRWELWWGVLGNKLTSLHTPEIHKMDLQTIADARRASSVPSV